MYSFDKIKNKKSSYKRAGSLVGTVKVFYIYANFVIGMFLFRSIRAFFVCEITNNFGRDPGSHFLIAEFSFKRVSDIPVSTVLRIYMFFDFLIVCWLFFLNMIL